MESDLISRSSLLDKYTHAIPANFGKASGKIVVFSEDIEDAPSVDAVPVIHAYWILYGFDLYGNPVYKCSNCSGRISPKRQYCPDCGAQMDGKDEDNG